MASNAWCRRGAPPPTVCGQIAAAGQILHVQSSPLRALRARRANGRVTTRPRSRFKLARSRRISAAHSMRRDRARLNHDRGRVPTRPFASGARRSRDGDGLTCRACPEAAIWPRAVLGGAPLRRWNECAPQHDTIVSHVRSGSYPRLPCTVVELTSVLYEANKELGTLQVILASREQPLW